MASAPPLPPPTPPPELDLFAARGSGTGTIPVPVPDNVDPTRALVDLVTLVTAPLITGGGSLAEVGRLRTPAEELLQTCFRDEEADDAVLERGVVGREADPRELGPAPLASLTTLRYLINKFNMYKQLAQGEEFNVTRNNCCLF